MDPQGFPNMNSYSQKEDGSPNSDSQRQVNQQHPQMHITPSNYEYPYQMLHRYPESSQRSVHGHSLTPYTFSQSTNYVGDLGDDIHAMNEQIHTTQRYPAGSEPNVYSDLHTSLSMDIESPVVGHHLQQTGDTRLPGGRESTPLLEQLDYRQPLSGYHHVQSHTNPQLQGRGHPIQQRPRGHLQPGSGFYAPTQSIASSDAVTGHGRRGTGPVPPLQQQSHPQMQRLQQAQLTAPMVYDMSTVNNISESNRTISVHSTVAGSYGPSSHASSSIPMSNNPPPPLPSPRHSHHNILHHEIGNTRHQHQGQPQTRHQTRNTSGAPSPSAYHPDVLQGRRPSDLELENSTSASNPSLHIHHQQHPNSRARSPDPSTIVAGVTRLLRPALTTKPSHRQLSNSPHPHSDADSIGGSAGSVKYEDTESEILNSDGSLRLKPVSSMSTLADGGKGKVSMGKRGGEGRDDGPPGGKSPESATVAQGPGGGEETSQGPPKKKKKSKMHECEVCGKKFPRPSGLKTHMNTHNNEKPYPCGFPGCTRTFGVRSNAKRHLRTHGVIPAPASPSEPPYIVGFSPPVIMPAYSQGLSVPNDLGGDGAGLNDPQGFGVDGASLEINPMGFGTAEGVGPGNPRRLGRASQFKLRWMPPSLMSRTNASSLREVHDEQDFLGDPEEEEEEEGGSDNMEDEDVDGEEAEFGDVELGERFSLPLKPVLPFSSAGASHGYSLGGSGSESSFAISSGSPPRPSNSSTCTSALSHVSPSPSPSASSFANLPSSASISRIPTTRYHYSKILTPGGSRLDDLSLLDFEERNSYLDAGSHPYHPLQPPDNATTP